ncbi:MAG: hypothetical protein IPI11_14775 [Haliscomenobacter sp.]|nr:hypothetical protein [Haliscomenobacter sp.]
MRALLFLFLAGIALAGSSCSYNESAFADQSGQSGSITRFAVFKGYMYALNQNEVQTYRLKDDGDPDLVHRLPTDYGLETIFIYENTIFLGSRTAMYILDITNPAAPALLSKSDRQDSFFGGCDPVVVQGHYASSTVKIIQNISRPRSPPERACWSTMWPTNRAGADRHLPPEPSQRTGD